MLDTNPPTDDPCGLRHRGQLHRGRDVAGAPEPSQYAFNLLVWRPAIR